VIEITASREAKRLVLAINKIYMNTKEATLMDLMKRLTRRKSIDIRLKGRPNLEEVLTLINKRHGKSYCKIISVESVTHDVKRFTIQKPEGFKFIPDRQLKCP
jgi:flagellar motor component MotA